jgi:hypothetical protein
MKLGLKLLSHVAESSTPLRASFAKTSLFLD